MTFPVSLVLTLALVAYSQDDAKPAPDQALLAKAEEQAADGKYSQAIATYKKLAKRFPTTPAGYIGKERSQPNAYLGWTDIVRAGPSANRVDVVVMGDGFTKKHLRAFDDLSNDLPKVFEKHHVLGEYYTYFNFLRAALVSADSGADEHGREYDTILDGQNGGFENNQAMVDRAKVQGLLTAIPEHDELAIVYVFSGTIGSGGAGVACIGNRSEESILHHWGHAFAGLSDEYASYARHEGQTPEGINVFDSDDPDRVPWRHWLEAKARGIGTYQGADGVERGVWKPTNNCAMTGGTDFCPVCREALILRIHRNVDPIEGCTPPPHATDTATSLQATDKLEFEVSALVPNSHGLQISWYVLAEADVPEAPMSIHGVRGVPDRRSRGPLQAIEARPAARIRSSKREKNSFTFKPGDHDPGRYRVVCRVLDNTRIRGDKLPWVLKDEHGLLESERAWWVVVPE